MHPQAPSRGTVYDPNDLPRTTIKETNIDNNRTGNVDSSYYNKPLAYNPNDIMPRATIKETTIAKDTMGNMNRQKDNAGYRLKKVKAPVTNRQMCNTDYTGNAEGQSEGGYKVANAVPRSVSYTHLTLPTIYSV